VADVKKTLILVLMIVCLLSVTVGCGSESQEPAKKDYGPPMDISLSSEESETPGIHLRLPDNSPLVQSEDDKNYYQTSVNLDEPLSCEIVVHVRFYPAEDCTHFSTSASEEDYTAASALINWSEANINSDVRTVKERGHIGGTAALVTTWSEKGSWSDDMYECTEILLAMNSGYTSIIYDDLGGRYGDLIQQSIDSIRIDEGEIPEIVRMTSPEGLQAVGLREQPWEIDAESFGVYLNTPTDFIPLKQDNGNLVWIAPDGNTMISAEVIDTTIIKADGKSVEKSLAQTIPGFGDFDFSTEPQNDLYAARLKYKTEGDNGEAWVNMVVVAPQISGEAIAVTVASRSKENAELPDVMNTLRFADGWDNGGALDMEAIAVSAEDLGEDQG
jgi:hypothetical protein